VLFDVPMERYQFKEEGSSWCPRHNAPTASAGSGHVLNVPELLPAHKEVCNRDNATEDAHDEPEKVKGCDCSRASSSMLWEAVIKSEGGAAHGAHVTTLPPLQQEVGTLLNVPKLLPAHKEVRDCDNATKDAHDKPDEAEREVAVAKGALRGEQELLGAAKGVCVKVMAHFKKQLVTLFQVFVNYPKELADRCTHQCSL
jgi:hypothetical protein